MFYRFHEPRYVLNFYLHDDALLMTQMWFKADIYADAICSLAPV